MSKPNYRVTLHYDVERKVFLARVPELQHCTAEGPTRSEATRLLEEEIDAQLANMLSHGTTPPRAVDEEEYSGEIACKLSRTLHRELAVQARSEGIDLDHLVGELIASALEGRKNNPRGRHGNRVSNEGVPHDGIGNRSDGGRGRNFGRGSNPAMLDDRANFIEYVRTLDQGSAGPGNGGGGGYNRGQNQGGGGRGGGQRRRGGPGGGRPFHGGGGGGGRPDGRNQNQGHAGQQGQGRTGNPVAGSSAPPAAPSSSAAPPSPNGHASHDDDQA